MPKKWLLGGAAFTVRGSWMQIGGMNDAETMGTGGNATCSMGNHPII